MVKSVITPKRYSVRLRAAARKVISPSLLQLEGMNDDCLEHVFNCLDINSLMKMCEVGNRIKRIVTTRVIPLKTVNFAEVTSVRKAFTLFGASMTRIIVHRDDIVQMRHSSNSRFCEFLCMLLMYGTPGRLKQVNLSFCGNESGIPSDVLNRIGPYFENVHTLNFKLVNEHMESFHQFMNAIPKQNLRTLSIHNVQVIGDWLVAEALPHLREIHICERWGLLTPMNVRMQIEELNETRLIDFISNRPAALTHVDFDCSARNRFFVELSQRWPNIPNLGTLMWWPNADARENISATARNEIHHEKWNFLNAFKNLKFIKLVSFVTDCSELGEVFRILATQNTIERLALTIGWNGTNGGQPVLTTNLRKLTQLKTLDLVSFLPNAFLSELIHHLPALTKCTINPMYSDQTITQADISNVIKLAQKLTVLIIYCDVCSFTPRFYGKLLKIRTLINAKNDTANALTIYFSKKSIHDCIKALGDYYQPSIITLKTTDFKSLFC